jgi:hypothetical protein
MDSFLLHKDDNPLRFGFLGIVPDNNIVDGQLNPPHACYCDWLNMNIVVVVVVLRRRHHNHNILSWFARLESLHTIWLNETNFGSVCC